MSNLPKQTSGFIGRTHDVFQAARLLSEGRLLTLTGPPGVGKTRLGLRVAAQVRRRFTDGVWRIDVADVQDAPMLAAAVVNTLGIHQRSGRGPLESLATFLEDKKTLLVLDNCEHLLDECAGLVQRLLRSAARLRVLVTSRQVLGLSGETVFRVSPMALPPLSALRLGQDRALETVNAYDAVRLFAARAQTVFPDFAVDASNYESVTRLCWRLEGIPLALELAAVRVNTLSTREILAWLDERVEPPSAGAESIPHPREPGRRPTLRATIGWSFQLCSPAEQALWARLSVFASGFDLEAAEQVCAGHDLRREDILDLVSGLVEKSVLSCDVHGTRARYHMLDVIRAFGSDRLADRGEQAELRARHQDHYRALALRAQAEWLSPTQVDWHRRLPEEHANIRAALDFCFESPDYAAQAVDMLIALRYYWIVSGALAEGRHWLDRIIARQPATCPARARALWAASHLALLQSDLVAALPKLTECAAVADQLGDTTALTYHTQVSGLAALLQGHYADAVTLLEDALNRHGPDDRNDVWLILYHLTLAHALRGNIEQAEESGLECLALSQRHGAPVSTSYALWVVGAVKWWRHDAAHARELVRQALSLKQEWTDQWGIAHCLETLAWICTDDAERPATLLGAADALFRSSETSASTLGHLSASHQRCELRVRRELGDPAFAEAFHRGTQLELDQAVALAWEV